MIMFYDAPANVTGDRLKARFLCAKVRLRIDTAVVAVVARVRRRPITEAQNRDPTPPGGARAAV